MHNAGYIHGDIKPSNVLITDEYRLKLNDFELSTNKNILNLNSFLGTPGYIAP